MSVAPIAITFERHNDPVGSDKLHADAYQADDIVRSLAEGGGLTLPEGPYISMPSQGKEIYNVSGDFEAVVKAALEGAKQGQWKLPEINPDSTPPTVHFCLI